VVQAAALAPRGAPDEGEAVMVGADPEEDHAAGDHGVGVAIAHLEAEDAGVEGHRAVQVGDVEHDVADLAELELHRRPVYRRSPSDGPPARPCGGKGG
jgi:hypothetical protein